MRKFIFRLGTLCLLLMVSCQLMASETVTALWDFKNLNPETLKDVNIQGTEGTVASGVDGIFLTVDATATNGKLAYNSSGYAQFNSGTKIQVPVETAGDLVTVISYPGQYSYTVGGVAATANETTHKATSDEATLGYVEIVATGGAYLYSIQVVQYGTVKEKKLYSTTFTDWTTKKASTTEAEEGPWTTKYSKETLTFKVFNTDIYASNTTGKFTDWTDGVLMAAKSSDPYIQTTALASITKVVFKHGAMGDKRGWKLEAKGKDDTEWVTISDAYVSKSKTIEEVTANVNRENCELRFTNLNSEQNAYLFALDIYGNVNMEGTPALGSFTYNGVTYEAADIFTETSETEQTATIKLKNDVTLPSETNQLIDFTLDNGNVGTVTYTTNEDGSVTVSIPVTAETTTVTYNVTFSKKPYYTLTYYNTDGKELEATQKVEEDEKITTLRGSDDVTVADSKAFRGWFVSAAGGRKYTVDDVVTSDLSLYAVATDIESTTSTSARYAYDLTDQYFYDEDHEAFEATGAAWHDASHGWSLSSSSEINFQLVATLTSTSNFAAKAHLASPSRSKTQAATLWTRASRLKPLLTAN